MKKYGDLAGDGGSNIAEQVAQPKENIASSVQPLRHRLAIGSGKGGATIMLRMAVSICSPGNPVNPV